MLTLWQGLTISFPFMIFIFYQWTLKDSWLSLLLSVIAFLTIFILVSYPVFLTIRITRHSLYSGGGHFALESALYAQYRAPRYYCFLLPLVGYFCKAICISFADGNGEVQVILMVILETLTVITHLALRPCRTKGDDLFLIFLASVRLLCTALTIAFVERLKLAPIPRVVIGLVIAAIFSVAVIITFINLIAESGIKRLWKHRRLPDSVDRSSSGSALEKGDLSTLKPSDHVDRSINPTPQRSITLDPHISQPFPISPTTTATEQSSLHSHESRTITIGSMLPRRWSFSSLNSPTTSQTGGSPPHTPQPSPRMVS